MQGGQNGACAESLKPTRSRILDSLLFSASVPLKLVAMARPLAVDLLRGDTSCLPDRRLP